MVKSVRGCYGEIAELVASTRAHFNSETSNSCDVALLYSIWHALCDRMCEVLITKKSVIIPNFVHASIKVRKFLYWDGERVFYKPQLVILPDFMSKFHVQNVLVMKDLHYHETQPCYVNYSAIASLVGTTHNFVEAAVKDSIREIGKYTQRNKNSCLTIDIGIGWLEFTGNEYRMKWNKSFLQRLQANLTDGLVVETYDPPSLSRGGPNSACRISRGLTSSKLLESQLNETLAAEARPVVAEMYSSNLHEACDVIE